MHMEAFRGFWSRYKKIIIGALIGLAVAILFLTIGFFATLLILILVGLGMLFGAYPELWRRISGSIASFFGKIFKG